MPTYLVTYDLKAPGRKYEPVWDYLKSTGTHWHFLGSCWLIVTTKTAAQVRDDLRPLIDSNDRVMVVRVDGANWATQGFDGGGEWMKAHVAG